MPRRPHRLPLPRPRRSAGSGASFGGGKDDMTRVNVPRELRRGHGGLNLATALQRGPFTGLARTRAFIHEFTERIHSLRTTTGPHSFTQETLTGAAVSPPCLGVLADQGWWVTRWNRVSRMLLNPRDTVEEWT